jgi:hypothetical protein
VPSPAATAIWIRPHLSCAYHPTGKAANAPRDNAIAELTDRELDVLTLIGKAPPTTGSLRH